jgi:signal transduction histidine kinase
MGGTAGVVSQAGKGARFWVELTAADNDVPNKTKSQDA